MARILVTGGAGYVGSHACKALAAAGFEPVVLDNLSMGRPEAVKWGPLQHADLRDREAVARVLAEVRPDAVMHFAALAYVGDSVANPGVYWGVNVGGTLNLIEAMRDAGIGALVFSSTCAIYGIPPRVPLVEDMPKLPLSPYGATKLACEMMLEAFDAAHGLRSVRLRYFNAAGADPDGEIGERHDPETHLIPLVLDAALGRRRLAIFGTDYPTPDGTALRDYVHVCDLASAHVAALRHLLAGGGSEAVNLGSGQGATVREVIRVAESVTGRAVPVDEKPRRAGDPPALVADPSRAAAVLGWTPRADLRAMITDAWAWHRKLNG